MKDTAIEIILGIMKAYGISTGDINKADESIAKNYYVEMTSEDNEEKAWLDKELRGKEEDLRNGQEEN